MIVLAILAWLALAFVVVRFAVITREAPGCSGACRQGRGACDCGSEDDHA